ncbi:hypothetical protein C725_1813 [Pacificimonas flava]|uniref:Uncharacterized protein n=1 Tax=Pacificimonas flava TaxID=1234595 RepID=M2U466_9SPHN|nr:hypothetical protein C725_1813 [Pacificimonas flava]
MFRRALFSADSVKRPLAATDQSPAADRFGSDSVFPDVRAF